MARRRGASVAYRSGAPEPPPLIRATRAAATHHRSMQLAVDPCLPYFSTPLPRPPSIHGAGAAAARHRSPQWPALHGRARRGAEAGSWQRSRGCPGAPGRRRPRPRPPGRGAAVWSWARRAGA
ncbi:unnamed protein product [Urochloa humidicola]